MVQSEELGLQADLLEGCGRGSGDRLFNSTLAQSYRRVGLWAWLVHNDNTAAIIVAEVCRRFSEKTLPKGREEMSSFLSSQSHP